MSRSRRNFIWLVLAYRLERSFVLSFASPPESWSATIREGTRFMDRYARRLGKRPFYAFVAEASDVGRFHLHLQLPRDTDHDGVRAAWGSRGNVIEVWVGQSGPARADGMDDLRDRAAYDTKWFDRVPSGRRYRSSSRMTLPDHEYEHGESPVDLLDRATGSWGPPTAVDRLGIESAPITRLRWNRPLIPVAAGPTTPGVPGAGGAPLRSCGPRGTSRRSLVVPPLLGADGALRRLEPGARAPPIAPRAGRARPSAAT